MKKNDIVKLEITALSSDGNGVGRFDGMVIFVPRTAVGDVIMCRIVKVLKNYSYGIIDSILSPSADRIAPDCIVSGKCGGCVFRHISYDAELSAKDKFVRDAFRKTGWLDIPFEPVLGAEKITRYRNKAQFPLTYLNGRAVCGFYAPNSHRVVPCSDCLLQPKCFSDITACILEFINNNNIPVYDENTGKGLVRHIYLRRGHYSGEIMVCLVVKYADAARFEGLGAQLSDKFPDVKSFVLNENPARSNVILGEKCVTVKGSDIIYDTMCKNIIGISPLSFYQVNTPQAEKLYETAADYAALKPSDILLDLYCGAGTIGLSMAGKVKEVIGCEAIPQAVENAARNARANNIKNAEFILGDAGETAAELARKGIRPNVVITDPPRKGCSKKTLEAITEMAPEKIVMISCAPSTAARDVAYLCSKGYSPVKARAVDLFPRTSHVETVVLMSRVKK